MVLECMDFISETSYGFLVSRPRTKPLYKAFLSPFSPMVWAAIILATVSTGLLVSANKGKYPGFTWLKYLGTVVGQDLENRVPRRQYDGVMSWALKFVPLGTWLLATFTLSAVYGALIIKYFVDPYEGTLRGLDDILKTNLEIVNSPVENILIQYTDNSSENPQIRELKGRMKELPFDSYLDFYPSANQAFLQERVSHELKAISLKEANDQRWKTFYVVTGSEAFPRLYKTVLVRKDSDWSELAKKATSGFVEHGIFEHFERIRLGDLGRHLGSESKQGGTDRQEEHVSIKLEHIAGMFLLYGIGMGLSIIAALGEILWAAASPANCLKAKAQHI